MSRRRCWYCGLEEGLAELRPDDLGGAPICSKCIKASPEREAQAKRAFGAQLMSADIAGAGISTLTLHGPEPGARPDGV